MLFGMTPFSNLLSLLTRAFLWEWRAHRSLWLGVLVLLFAAASGFAVLEESGAWPKRLLDAVLVLEMLFFAAFLAVRRAVDASLPEKDPRRSAMPTVTICAAGLFSSIAGLTVFLRSLL